MRVAVLADLHGNLPALEAVLAELEQEPINLIVVGGDVASGPLPSETIELMRTLTNARFVRGNADRGVVAAYDDAPLPDWPGPAAQWCAGQLSRAQRDFLASFEDTVRLQVAGIGRVLFCHGSPRSDEEIMTVATPLARLRELLAGVDADVVVCGHTHMQFDRAVDGVRLV
jgi:putative phosphoesterase